MNKVFHSIILLIFSLSVLCQSNEWRRYMVEDGLSDNHISGIVQDGYGFLWISTINGLNRYDGDNFEIFRRDPDDPESLMNNNISRLYKGFNDDFWLFANIYLIHYNKEKEIFEKTIRIENQAIDLFNISPSEVLARYISRFIYYNLETKEQKLITINLKIRSIAVDDNNVIWFLSNNNNNKYLHYTDVSELLHKKNTKLKKKIINTDKNIQEITFSGFDRHLWFKVDKNDQIKILDEDGSLSDPGKIDKKYSVLDSLSILKHYFQDNELLFLTENKIGVLNLANGITQFIPVSKELSQVRGITCLSKDKFNNVWVGTRNGLFACNLQSNPFITYEFPTTSFKPDINSLNTGVGNNFIVCYDDGIVIMNEDLRIVQKFTAPVMGVHIIFKNGHASSCIDVGKGFYIMSGGKLGLYLVNPDKNIFLYIHPDEHDSTSLSDWSVRNISRNRKGDLWISTFSGLCYIKHNELESFLHDKYPGNCEFRIFPKFKRIKPLILKGNVWCTNEDSQERVWIGCSAGLYCYNQLNENIIKYSPDIPSHKISEFVINNIYEDSKNRIWVSTKGGGLNLMNENTGSIKILGEKQGLSDIIWLVIEDDKGDLWMSTNNGLRRYNPETGQITAYYKSDGLPGNKFNFGSGIKTPDGSMIFGQENNIIRFHPDSIRKNSIPPDVIISKICLFNIPVRVDKMFNKNIILKKSILLTDKVVLSYKNNVFSIHFNIIHLTNPSNNHGQYILEGFDKNWIGFKGSSGVANYSNLPAGKYIFRVQGANADGVWNKKEEKMFVVMVLPPFWETWWFRLLVIIIMAASVYIFFRWRIYALQKQKEELEFQVKERTTEIVQMNEELKAQADTLREVNGILTEQKEEITAQKEEIESQAGDLVKLNATKDKFFSIIGHDLKNPMYAINSLAKMLVENRKKLPEEQLEEICKMLDQSSHGVTTLLENLLTWARSQSGKMEFRPERIDLAEIAAETIQVLRMSAENKGIKLINEIGKGCLVYADKNMITTVIRNLINNAVKFTPSGSVTLSCLEVDLEKQISVKDTGIGMDEEMRNKLFRIDVHHTTQGTSGEAGTGLGLIICKEFVEKNKGRIWIESEPGKGSSFIFSLPI